MYDDGYHFYPLIRCTSCSLLTKDWKWVTHPVYKEEVYGVCKDCEKTIQNMS